MTYMFILKCALKLVEEIIPRGVNSQQGRIRDNPFIVSLSKVAVPECPGGRKFRSDSVLQSCRDQAHHTTDAV